MVLRIYIYVNSELFQLFNRMRDLERDLPFKDDHEILSRIKRTNFYCVQDDFLAAWREHERFLVVYEEKVKKTLMRQAKISEIRIYLKLI